MEFIKLKTVVAKQFELMTKHGLYRTDTSKDELWDTYLSSFPPGTDPMFRARTNHDCNCCKQFIRAVGNVVSIINGKLVSIWDVTLDENNQVYQTVANALSTLVKSKPITNQFLHTEKTAGTDKSFEDTVNGISTYNHFFINIPTKYVKTAINIGPILSEKKAIHDVFLRGLNELTLDSIDTVIELIDQNSLYRGSEHKFAVSEFRKLKVAFSNKDDNFAWEVLETVPVSVTKIRNTSIGTLLQDLSNGVDLEDAVKSFESMVAPTNYKRPTALISKTMIEKAKKAIESLGLTSALERRYATLTDLNVNNVIFIDRTAKSVITGDVFDDISNQVTTNIKKFDKVEEVSIEQFIANIVPKATSIEIMIDNNQQNNLVSLIAPVDPTANSLFKWNNNFSWDYNGGVTDSIKERVKAAGGNVTGELCCRLAWNNTDDLDFHMEEPNYHIYYSNRSRISNSGGMLDVDANGISGMMKHPVENIYYQKLNTMKPGKYKLYVHQYSKRSSDFIGFTVEIDLKGTIYHFHYDKPMKTGTTVVVAEFEFINGELKLVTSLNSSNTINQIWGIKTNTFQKVNVMMLSPNYWDDFGVGNKHYFFMLNGCINDGTARGFFNEFLKPELNEHRKVIEIVGSKMKTNKSNNQLSGVGFSSTKRDSVMCRVKGSFTRIVKIVF